MTDAPNPTQRIRVVLRSGDSVETTLGAFLAHAEAVKVTLSILGGTVEAVRRCDVGGVEDVPRAAPDRAVPRTVARAAGQRSVGRVAGEGSGQSALPFARVR